MVPMDSENNRAPLRINFLHIAGHGSLAGGFRVIVQYADALQRRGHVVTMIGRAGKSKPRFSGLLRHLPLKKKPQYHDDFLKGKDLKNIVPEPWGPILSDHVPDADIMVGSWYETVPWMAAMPPSKGIPIHFVQHHETVNVQDHDHDGSKTAAAVKAHQVPMHRITIADWLVETLETKYGLNDIRLSPNGVDTEFFNAPPRGKQEQPTIGFMCSTAKFKRVRMLKEILESIRSEHPSVRFVSFGHPPLDKAKHLLPENTNYTSSPAQEHLKQIYASADVWVMASDFEGFGLPILEALACRTPVVSTLTGVAGSAIKNDVNGYAVPVADVEGLKEAVWNVASADPTTWKAMSSAARETALRFDWSSRYDAFEEALYAAKAGRF